MAGKSLSRDFVFVMIGNLVSFIVSVCFPVVLVRVFTVEQYGSYYQIIACAGLMGLMFSIGLRPSLFFFSVKNPDDHQQLIFNALVVNIVLCAVVFVISFFFLDSIAKYMSIEAYLVFIPIMALYLAAENFSTVLTAHFLITDRSKYVALTTSLFAVSRAVVLITVAVASRSVAVSLSALVIYTVIKTTVVLFILRTDKSQRGAVSLVRVIPTLSMQLKYSLPLGLSAIVRTAVTKIDKAIISGSYGASSLAMYQVGFFRLPIVTMFYNSLAEVMLPRLTRSLAVGNKKDAFHVWVSAIEKSALVFFPFSLYFMAVGDSFIEVMYTSNYLDAVPVFRACMMITVFQAVSYATVIRAAGKTRYILWLDILAALTFVAALPVLKSHYGMLGVALSVVGSYLVYAVSVVTVNVRLLNFRFRDLPLARVFGLLAVSIVVVFGVRFLCSLLFQNDILIMLFSALSIPLVILSARILRLTSVDYKELLKLLRLA